MKQQTARAALSVLMISFAASLAFLALFVAGGWAPTAQADPGVTIGIDADSTGNTATSLGSREECFSIDSAQQTDVDLFITDVLDLLSFSAWLFYDEAVVNIAAVDVEQFLVSDGGTVWNSSHYTPDSDGLYYVAAAETTAGAEPSGSGVLARITLEGVGSGISPLWLSKYPEDVVIRPSNGPDIVPDARYHARIGVDQVDSDGDTLADMCDPDVDSDGDTVYNPADADDDDDNYSDQVEAFLGTDPLDDCPNVVGEHDAWPPDNNANRSVDILDVLNFKPYLVSQFMDPDYDRRFDMNADQNINIMDVLSLKPYIGTECTNP